MSGIELTAWVAVALAVTLIGVTKSGFGAGVGLMIVPMTAISLSFTGRGEVAALGLLLPLLILGDVVAVAQHRDHWDFSAMKRLLPATAVGVVAGGLLLWWIKEQKELVAALMRIEIGLESIILVGLHWWRQRQGTTEKLWPEPWRGHVSGGFAAISSTLAHAAGPIIAMYLLPLNLQRRVFVATCAVYFFFVNTAKLPAYWQAGLFEVIRWQDVVMFAPLVLVGAVLGRWINQRMSDKLFTSLVYGLTFALGWYVLGSGLWTLAHQLGWR